MLRLPQFLQGLRPHADLIETEAKVSTSCEEARRFASLRSMGETRHVNDKDNVEAEGRGFTVPHIVPKVVDVPGLNVPSLGLLTVTPVFYRS